jgi:hypothetical protein
MIKYTISLLVFIIMHHHVCSQTFYVKKEFVEGIVVSKYHENDIGLQLLDGMPNYQGFNKGDFTHDYISDLNKGIYTNDLTISDFDFHTEEGGSKIVKSITFYYKNNSKDLYSVYRFSGVVVFYEGDNPLIAASEDECPCPGVGKNYKNFAVLINAFNVDFLTEEQEKKLKIKKSSVRRIEVFFCE